LPLPDAKPDKRIYELLKTVDLENLTFSEFQGVAKTIYAEQNAEDELRRIVLVNLARLAVKGNWDGLTSGGSSGGGSFVGPNSAAMNSTDRMIRLESSAPLPGNTPTTSSFSTNLVQYYPFVAPVTGNIDTVTMRTTGLVSGQTMLVGFYENTSDDYPGAQVGGTTFISLASSTSPSNSPSSTVSLTRGTTYWVAYCKQSSSAGNPTCWVVTDGPIGYNDAISQAAKNTLRETTNSNSLPATAPTTGYTVEYAKKLILGVEMV